MCNSGIVGWDVGGAHLKLALLGMDGSLRMAKQLPSPLWRGVQRFETAMQNALDTLPDTAAEHGVTFTGELADVFETRAIGITTLITHMVAHLGEENMRIYAGRKGFVGRSRVSAHTTEIASANWHASVRFVSMHLAEGILIDIGSTTTDIVPFAGGEVCCRGYTDSDRMQYDELLYTGIVRTPIIAVTQRIPFAGEWQYLAAEHFATMADVYRLTGALPVDADLLETPDGASKSVEDSARRLARMLGRDLDAAKPFDPWCGVARYIANLQLARIYQGLERTLSRHVIADDAPLIGAGTGRFLVRDLANRLGRPFVDFSELIDAPLELKPLASDCAPAVAVAQLLRMGH
ncbi:MAG: hydantoinase/oxoprolinase family protein [Gammaproteobacteria bacterium]